MSTLDLDAIRGRLHKAGMCSELDCDVDALISEVEALRYALDRSGKEAHEAINSLRAKLEKATDTLREIARCVLASEALAELGENHDRY